jgi:hypothetical protein
MRVAEACGNDGTGRQVRVGKLETEMSNRGLKFQRLLIKNVLVLPAKTPRRE